MHSSHNLFGNLFFFVSAGVRQFETKWIGWAGVNVSDEVGQVALKKALEEKVLPLKTSFLAS